MMRVGTRSLAVFAAMLLGMAGCQADNATSPATPAAARTGSSGTSPWYDAAQMQNIERVAELLAEGLGAAPRRFISTWAPACGSSARAEARCSSVSR